MANYEQLTYLIVSRDPVHVGAGGYRLGRVDNSIVREPGTGVPKIPGASLHGAIRAYAARQYENLDAAGQTHEGVTQPEADPVCYTFGYLTTPQGDDQDRRDASGFAGVANVFDAQLLFFPVRSARGPLWVTTPSALANAGVDVTGIPDEWARDVALPAAGGLGTHANLGWLHLPVGDPVSLDWPSEWVSDEWNAIAHRIVLVQDGLFSHIVNSNLEVRTSVSIDPRTGAAKRGALFTYEALPRATFLTFDVVVDDYRREPFPAKSETKEGNALPGGRPWTTARNVIEAGIDAIEWLGIGGMGTRGFGRLGRLGRAKEGASAPAVITQ